MVRLKSIFQLRLFYLLLLIGVVAVSILTTAFLSQQYFASKKISAGWKTYQGSHFPFKVKIPPDAQSYESVSSLKGSDNGSASFTGKNYQARIVIWTNDRNDKTLKDLMEVRNFNGITNVGMPICCSKGDMVVLPNGRQTIIEDSFLQNGGKFGIQAMILGKKYYYIISSGSIYHPNFTHREEEIFMEFLNSFQTTD